MRTRLAFIFSLGLLCAGISPTIAISDTYKCHVQSFKSINDDGIFITDKMMTFAYDGTFFIWNDESGLLRQRLPNQKADEFRWQMKVLEKRTNGNNSVGFNIIKGKAATSVASFSVRTWKKNNPFIFFTDFPNIWTGRCNRV